MLNAVDFLTGRRRDQRLLEVTVALAAEMLVGGLASSTAEGDEMAREALKSGRAAECFQRMVSALGGPADFVEEPLRYLPRAALVRPVLPHSGSVTAIDTREVGLAVVAPAAAAPPPTMPSIMP